MKIFSKRVIGLVIGLVTFASFWRGGRGMKNVRGWGREENILSKGQTSNSYDWGVTVF